MTSSAPQAISAWEASECRAVDESSQVDVVAAGASPARVAPAIAWSRRDAGAPGTCVSSRWPSAVRRSPRWAHASAAARCAAWRGGRVGVEHVAGGQHGRRPARALDGRADGGGHQGGDRGGLQRHPVVGRALLEVVEGRHGDVELPAVDRLLGGAKPRQPADRRGRRVDLVGARERGGCGAGSLVGAEREAEPDVEQVAVQPARGARRPVGHGTEQRVDVSAVQVGGVAIAAPAGRCSGDQRQCRRRLERVHGHAVRGIGDGAGVVERRAEPPVDGEAPDQGPVAGEAGVSLGVDGMAVGHEPRRRPLVHLGHEVGVPPAQRGPQQVGEQGVVAVPAVVDGVGEEHARPLEVVEPHGGVGVGRQEGGQVGGEPFGDAGAEQEALRVGILAVEHLLEQVVGHRSLGRRRADHDLVRVARVGERTGGEPEAGRPALGARPQRAHVLGPEVEARALEQLAGLVEGELEVGVPDLAQPAVEAQPAEGDGWVGPGAEDEGQAGWHPLEQGAQGGQGLGRPQLVDVVEHQHPRARRQGLGHDVEQGGVGSAPAASTSRRSRRCGRGRGPRCGASAPGASCRSSSDTQAAGRSPVRTHEATNVVLPAPGRPVTRVRGRRSSSARRASSRSRRTRRSVVVGIPVPVAVGPAAGDPVDRSAESVGGTCPSPLCGDAGEWVAVAVTLPREDDPRLTL